MCGFLGIFSPKGPGPDRPGLETVLAHRGPDHAGRFADGRALLVHNRLSIIDLSPAGDQPMTDPETGNVLVYNGEVYNFRELRRTHPDIAWRTESDSEVLLKLYAKLGPEFVAGLNGIFAFAIYEPRAGRAFLCRDRFGVKPLYYSLERGELAVASEIRGLAPFRELTPSLPALAAYFAHSQVEHGSETFYRGVRQLPPAHWALFDLASGGLSARRYWQTPTDLLPDPEDEDLLLDQVQDRLDRAMALNLVSDVEIGVSLSSGADSTLMARMLERLAPERMRAFTFGFAEEDYDEIRRVRANPALAGLDPTPVVLAKKDLLDTLDRAAPFYDIPIGGVGILAAFAMMEQVRAAGIKVMLSGEGSDETFGGYRYYFPALFKDIEQDPALLESELDAYCRVHGVAMKPFDRSYRELMAGLDIEAVFAPDGTRAAGSSPGPALDGVSPLAAPADQPAFSSRLKAVMHRDLTVKKIPKLLHYQDRSSMAHGVETRVPYLDHELVEFLYRLPPTRLIRRGRAKHLLRRLLAERLGVAAFPEVKHYVATPQREWLKDAAVRDAILDRLRNGVLVSRGLLDFGSFERDYRRYSEAPELGNSFFAWKVASLEAMLARLEHPTARG